MITVYHISPKKNRDSIKKSGLIPQRKDSGRIKFEPRIFVSKDKKHLGFDYVNFENVDCWTFKIDSKLLYKDEFSSSDHHFYLECSIGPEKLILDSSY